MNLTRLLKISMMSKLTSNREKRLHVAVLLLQEIKLLDIPIYIVSHIVPRIGWVMFLQISITVRQYYASVTADIAEAVQNVRKI